MNNFPICGSYNVPGSWSQCTGRQGGAAIPEELSVESVRAVCIMMMDVSCVPGCRFCCNSWKETDPSCGSADPDWKVLQAGFSAGGRLQHSGL